MKKHKVYATKVVEFNSAHALPNYKGKCADLHGHNYKLEVTVSNYIDVSTPFQKSTEVMAIDFGILKKYMNLIVDKIDHKNLNDIPHLNSDAKMFNYTTAEEMCVIIYQQLSEHLYKEDETNMELEKVKIWETDTSYASYSGDTI